MFKRNFLEHLRRKAAEFEPEFRKQMERFQNWTSREPQETGFYYVRPMGHPETVHLHYFLIEEGHPFENNTILNRMFPAGRLLFLGPFGLEDFVAVMARADAEKKSYPVPEGFGERSPESCGCNGKGPYFEMVAKFLDKGLESVPCSGDPDYFRKEVQRLGIDLAKEDEELVVLEEGKVSFFRCKYCETPIFVGEAFSSDGKTYWHKECDGEVSCDCSEESSDLFDDSVKVKAVINIPAQTRTIEFSMSRSSVGVFDSPESQADFIHLGDLLTSKDFSVESFEIQEADDV